MLKQIVRWYAKQEYLRFGARDRVLRAFLDPDKNIGNDFEIDNFNGTRYVGKMDNFIDWSAYFYGAYEKDCLDKLYLPLLRSSDRPILLDIGANIGHHSLYLKSACHAIHAFEPDQGCQKEFERKIKACDASNITIHKFGLGENDAVETLYSSTTNNTGTNSLIANHSANNQRETKISIKNADKYIESLDLPSITLVKIDVEGFELEVLRGLPNTLNIHRPSLIIEISETTRSRLLSEEISIEDLLPSDYEFFTVFERNHLKVFRETGVNRVESKNLEEFVGDLACLPREKGLSTCLSVKA